MKPTATDPAVPFKWRVRWFLQGVASVCGHHISQERRQGEIDQCVDQMQREAMAAEVQRLRAEMDRKVKDLCRPSK